MLKFAILQTVAYADVFDYPLKTQEVHRYLTGSSASPEQTDEGLRELAGQAGPLRCVDGYYLLAGRESIVAIRLRREKIAARLWPRAVHYGGMIAALPFVRMVAVTGSLAMRNVEQDADLDYLVVTAPGRLWLCRAMALALGRWAALATLGKTSLCPNYLISENALEFPDQSLYAAHELAQMVPLSGMPVYRRIRALNPWVRDFLPNADGLPPGHIPPRGSGPEHGLKTALEGILRTRAGVWLERWEMRRKTHRLRAETGDNPEVSFSADVCKGHSNQHGWKTEQTLQERLARLALEITP